MAKINEIDRLPSRWELAHEVRHFELDGKNSWAVFSKDMLYRYRLRRWWQDGLRILFIMLNPSTADEIQNDPTVERCERRAKALGFGGFEVVNIFALRSTDPKGLYLAKDPVGEANVTAIDAAVLSCDEIVCAWGAHGTLLDQGERVKSLLQNCNRPVKILGLTQKGMPKHPLYISYKVRPELWDLSKLSGD